MLSYNSGMRGEGVFMAKVAILVGSKSDLPVVQKGMDILKEFGVSYDLTITSAHRALKNTVKVVENYQDKGAEVFIVCAGASAHLAGVTAALTATPVIAVPVGSSIFEGLDSLLSIIQMPKGIPVATVGVNSCDNAAILAMQVLALKDKNLHNKLKAYKQKLVDRVIDDNKSVKLSKKYRRLKIEN